MIFSFQSSVFLVSKFSISRFKVQYFSFQSPVFLISKSSISYFKVQYFLFQSPVFVRLKSISLFFYRNLFGLFHFFVCKNPLYLFYYFAGEAVTIRIFAQCPNFGHSFISSIFNYLFRLFNT